MTEPRKPSLILPVAVTLAVLLGLYVGAYYWLATPGFFVEVVYVPKFLEDNLDVETIQELNRQQAWRERFFAPIHWLDRRIRPHVWSRVRTS